MDNDYNDYRWLASSAGSAALAELRASTEPIERLVPRLRKQYSAEIVHRLIEQIDLQRRARDKFTQPETMLFTPRSLEQATDEWVASYKAARFSEHQPVVDLCCGAGGDLLALHRAGSAVGVDRDPLMAYLAGQNTGAEVRCGSVEKVDVGEFGAWHIDPDRRPTGERTTRVIDHQPGFDVLAALLNRNGHAAIKLAPAAIWPDEWSEQAEFEWLGRDGQCRQLVVWFGGLARRRGLRSATIIDRAGRPHQLAVGSHQPAEPAVSHVRRWLFEPDATVIAAGLTGALALAERLDRVAPQIAYLTGDEPRQSVGLAAFEVLEVLPFDRKRLRAWFKDHAARCVEVKKRGVELEPAKLLAELPHQGEVELSCLLMPQQGQTLCVVARRQVPSPG